MNIEDHAKNYAQVFNNEHDREIAYSGFYQGERFMQEQMIYKVRKELEGLSDAFKFLADIGRPSYGIDVDKVIESLLNENKE